MASSSTYTFFHCHYAFQKFQFFCVTLCVLHALQNACPSMACVLLWCAEQDSLSLSLSARQATHTQNRLEYAAIALAAKHTNKYVGTIPVILARHWLQPPDDGSYVNRNMSEQILYF